MVPRKLRAEVNEEERRAWEGKPAILSSQPYGLHCCSALNTLPLMIVHDTLAYAFSSPPPPPPPLSPRVK